MLHEDTDRDWEHFGNTDPYWAVLTDDTFRKENLTPEAIKVFYQSGEDQIASIFATIRKYLDDTFHPSTALDFGCGVGRLALPLAGRCQSVTGVDVSSGMLERTRSRCVEAGVSNLFLVKGDDELSGVKGSFDLITSYIVFQHIPTDRGERLVTRLIELLSDGGVGVLHITYCNTWLDHGPRQEAPSGFWYHCVNMLRAARERLGNLLGQREGKRASVSLNQEPVMQMNEYNLNRLLRFLQEGGVRRMHVEFTDHDGAFGLLLFFQKRHGDHYWESDPGAPGMQQNA